MSNQIKVINFVVITIVGLFGWYMRSSFAANQVHAQASISLLSKIMINQSLAHGDYVQMASLFPQPRKWSKLTASQCLLRIYYELYLKLQGKDGINQIQSTLALFNKDKQWEFEAANTCGDAFSILLYSSTHSSTHSSTNQQTTPLSNEQKDANKKINALINKMQGQYLHEKYANNTILSTAPTQMCIIYRSYNAQKHIVSTLRNVLMQQSYASYMFYVTDDASTDNSYILSKYEFDQSQFKDKIHLEKKDNMQGKFAIWDHIIEKDCKKGDVVILMEGGQEFIGSNALSLIDLIFKDPKTTIATFKSLDKKTMSILSNINATISDIHVFRRQAYTALNKKLFINTETSQFYTENQIQLLGYWLNKKVTDGHTHVDQCLFTTERKGKTAIEKQQISIKEMIKGKFA